MNYQEYAGGNLYLQSQILFYNAQQYLISSAARMPHTTGNVSAEIRPLAENPHHRIVDHGPLAQCRLFAADSEHTFAAERVTRTYDACSKHRWPITTTKPRQCSTSKRRLN